LPDLTITDIWTNGENSVCYQILNSGAATSPTPHTSGLWVDSSTVITGVIDTEIEPGKRLIDCFSSTWTCTPPQAQLQVCADLNGQVTESDEKNNCRVEIWKCDQTPPVISSGPTVTEITSTTVRISWDTNEPSNTIVEYDTRLERFESAWSDATLVSHHEAFIEWLLPATAYQFKVTSLDAAQNTVQSSPAFFETQSEPDSIPPTLADFTPARNHNTDWIQYNLEQEASDNQELERVEFYMDSTLVGTDYSNVDSTSGNYTANLMPGLLGIDRATFFSPHTANIYAYDRAGQVSVQYAYFGPTVEPMRGDLELLSSGPEDILYIPGLTVPSGTTVPITATAVVYDEECHPASTRDLNFHAPYVCSNVEHAVHRIKFSVAPEGGSYQVLCDRYPTNDSLRRFGCNWNASGRTLGTYSILVQVYADDGSTLSDTHNFAIMNGTARLEAQRQVTRLNNYFRVRLVFHNRGNFPLRLDSVQDNLTGFQPIQVITGTTYTVLTPRYDVATKSNQVIVNLFSAGSTTYPLNPGESFTVEYLASPILYPELNTSVYSIGQAPVQVNYLLQGAAQVSNFNLPGGATDTGEMLGQAVLAARRASDYLIVTHPGRLFAVDPNTRNVNALLATIAELAQLKKGILGYLSDGSSPVVKSTYLRWGEEMLGSDGDARHFRYNGYLLLLGEAEIIGSWHVHHVNHHDFSSDETFDVNFSDNPFADTDNDSNNPEVIIGRVIGDDASELRDSIKNSVEVAKGLPGAVFDRTNALIVAGSGDGVEAFENNLDRVQNKLQPEFTTLAYKHRLIAASGRDLRGIFQQEARNKDVLFYRDHCNGTEWLDTVNKWGFDVPSNAVQFGTHRPFVFACCCQAGMYENVGDTGIAEEFLQHGAGAYIGATEVSNRTMNNLASDYFFLNWANHPSATVGRSLRDFKRDVEGYEGNIWTSMYNLYGDPKFGATTSALATELAPQPRLPAVPLATVDVSVPDYTISTTNGVSEVTIPGGGYLQDLGLPVVPTYRVAYQLADGDWVQEVTLTLQADLQVISDLNLKLTAPEWDCTRSAQTLEMPADVDPVEEWPDRYFDWRVEVGVDGHRYLIITIYPFHYFPLTAEGWFYKNFSFEVETLNSPVQLSFLAADKPVYDPGDSVLLEYWLDNPVGTQDVLISTVIRSAGSGEIVDSLPIHRLNSLGLRATYAQEWDTTGHAVGDYVIEAQVRDLSGAVLDTKRERISLGTVDGEATSLVVSQDVFTPDDLVDIYYDFTNLGTVPLTGTAVVQLRNIFDDSLVELTEDFSGLAPSGVLPLHFTWDTTGVSSGVYHLAAYAMYEARTTDPLEASLSTPMVYLPVVRR
jgi:hypothetical protein